MTFNLSIDFVMIIGKYFNSPNDFINIMKVNKKYKELVLMYRFNPISDDRLFEKIETQHFYQYSDIFYRKRNMFKYVYWLKPYLLTKYFDMISFDSNFNLIKDVTINKILNYINKIGYLKDFNRIYRFNFDILSLFKIKNSLVVFKYGKNYFGFKINQIASVYPKLYKSFYFLNDKELTKSCDVFISERYQKPKLFLRDEMFNSLLEFQIENDDDDDNNNENSNLINSYIKMEINDNYLLGFLPDLLKLSECYIIEYNSKLNK